MDYSFIATFPDDQKKEADLLKCVPFIRGDDHYIPFDSISTHAVPRPYPFQTYSDDTYDTAKHFILPCSKLNTTAKGELVWDNLVQMKRHTPRNVTEFYAAVAIHNPNVIRPFQALNQYLENRNDNTFFKRTLRNILTIALHLPCAIPEPFEYLEIGQQRSISFTQLQIATLIANAFLCTFPARDDMDQKMGNFNMQRLFADGAQSSAVKIDAFVSYLTAVCDYAPIHAVTITRYHMNRPYDWKSSTLRFMTNVQFIIEEPLQLAKKDTLVVDFANSFPGGGILMKGALQEEVLFCCYPELLVTRLVAERLDRDEVLLIHGVDKYNDMIGYGEKISIANNGPEQSPVGPDRRRRKQIVIMDALEFSGDNYQYGTTAIMRELNKALAGFLAPLQLADVDEAPLRTGVSTGHWGCGAFKGNKALKFLIQLLAATVANREGLYYHCMLDERFLERMHSLHYTLVKSNVTIGQFVTLLLHTQSTKNAFEDFVDDIITQGVSFFEQNKY